MDNSSLFQPPMGQFDSLEHTYNLAFVPLWQPEDVPISEMSNPQQFVHGAKFFGQSYPVSRAAVIDAPSDNVVCRLFYYDEGRKLQLNKRLLLPKKQMTKQVDQTEGFYCRGPRPSRTP